MVSLSMEMSYRVGWLSECLNFALFVLCSHAEIAGFHDVLDDHSDCVLQNVLHSLCCFILLQKQ
jgi:hypothetical protein